ncbi:hypothetical protein Lal_00022839 [Lupinus albus]|nr:hypothetical protein Lal_00022839 [Lupinus albus]
MGYRSYRVDVNNEEYDVSKERNKRNLGPYGMPLRTHAAENHGSLSPPMVVPLCFSPSFTMPLLTTKLTVHNFLVWQQSTTLFSYHIKNIDNLPKSLQHG